MNELNRLGKVLKEKKVSNRVVSKYLDKTEETISRWVNNHRQPSVEDLSRLAEFLHVDIRDLLVAREPDPAQEAPYIAYKKDFKEHKLGRFKFESLQKRKERLS